MEKNYCISIYLDPRRAKANGKYPVKLRVYVANPRKQKLYPTKIELSKKEFHSAWLTSRPRNEYKDLRRKLQAIELRANGVAEKLSPFIFEQFEKKLYRKSGDGVRIAYHVDIMIKEMNRQKRVGTASVYDLSRKSIIEYVVKERNQGFNKLTFYDINPGWLKDYQQYMTETKGRSLTTVGIYLRAIRTIFNKAIDENEIERGYYPFGKRKYRIPATKNTKRALSGEQLKNLFLSKPPAYEQQKAKDFWFFSFSCNGMNIKDIALLKQKDLQDDKFEFYRAKTKGTIEELTKIVVYLNNYSKEIIAKYGNKSKVPDNYIFDILTGEENPFEQHAKIQNFTRYINQHLKKLCKDVGLPEQISTYWARHSFASYGIRNGATMEFMQESLGHKNVKTTQVYFAGFDNDTKKKFASTLMNFD